MDEATMKHNRRYYVADRARFIADCGGCEMQELGELLEGE